LRVPAPADLLALSLPDPAALTTLHRAPPPARLHLAVVRFAPVARASDAVLGQAACLPALLLVRPFALRLLWPLLTSCSGSSPSPFQAQGKISPGKNAILHRTTAGFTPSTLDHKSFTVSRLLALVDHASYPILVHRLTVSLFVSSPRSVTLTQLRFTSLTVVSSRKDFHLQDRAHAGRTKEGGPKAAPILGLPYCLCTTDTRPRVPGAPRHSG
jgi:hypothetical protein